MFQVQNFVKAKENSKHLSGVISSLHMQLDESSAEKRRLQYENKSLQGRLDEIERGDRTGALYRNSVQEKDSSSRIRSSGHELGRTSSQSHGTMSVMRSESLTASDRNAGDRNLAKVCHFVLL